MTGEDFEQRLRKVEDWCLKHDTECDARHESVIQSMERIQRSLEKETAVGKETDGRVTALKKDTDDKFEALKDDFTNFKIKMAFLVGLSAAGGGLIGQLFSIKDVLP